jgi:hypothetical protein
MCWTPASPDTEAGSDTKSRSTATPATWPNDSYRRIKGTGQYGRARRSAVPDEADDDFYENRAVS